MKKAIAAALAAFFTATAAFAGEPALRLIYGSSIAGEILPCG